MCMISILLAIVSLSLSPAGQCEPTKYQKIHKVIVISYCNCSLHNMVHLKMMELPSKESTFPGVHFQVSAVSFRWNIPNLRCNFSRGFLTGSSQQLKI